MFIRLWICDTVPVSLDIVDVVEMVLKQNSATLLKSSKANSDVYYLEIKMEMSWACKYCVISRAVGVILDWDQCYLQANIDVYNYYEGSKMWLECLWNYFHLKANINETLIKTSKPFM